jgi:hypothetical protein
MLGVSQVHMVAMPVASARSRRIPHHRGNFPGLAGRTTVAARARLIATSTSKAMP